MGTGYPIYDGAPRRKQGQSGQFIGPDLEFRQSVVSECLGQRHIGGIAAARDQNSRKPRFVVARVEHVPFTSEKDLHPSGEVSRRMRERLTNVAQIIELDYLCERLYAGVVTLPLSKICSLRLSVPI